MFRLDATESRRLALSWGRYGSLISIVYISGFAVRLRQAIVDGSFDSCRSRMDSRSFVLSQSDSLRSP